MQSVLAHKKLLSQANACQAALSLALTQALGAGQPADRALNAFLRQNSQYGSRDRKVINEGVYAVFRWWGWLHRLDTTVRDWARKAAEADDQENLPVIQLTSTARLLLAAFVIDGKELPETAIIWANLCNIPQDRCAEAARLPNARERAAAILKLMRLPERELSEQDLVPSWTPQELAPETNLAKLLAWLQRRPPMWLRSQANDTDALVAELRAAGLLVEQDSRVPQALRATDSTVNLYALPSFKNGLFEVQDIASQVIGLACSPSPGQRWWDACAGGGGKSLQLSSLMQGKGSILASDLREYKLEELRKRARRANFSNIRTKEWNGLPLRARQAVFDGVLADAPCTCSGRWRRNPDARWNIDRDEIAEMASLQGRILDGAASGVKPGGVLVYATCSMFEQENSGVVKAFLSKHPDFALEPFTHPLSRQETDGTLQIWPWEGDCDSTFVARLRRSQQTA
ncbi:MAG: hypothetical protein A2X49_11460 [Lentisphaerae bacterium GWF2_52_8]|nr:MAG: hypothetical protein A2X49_11460 [Lentisphaerae bacterium GWF2_52_8]